MHPWRGSRICNSENNNRRAAQDVRSKYPNWLCNSWLLTILALFAPLYLSLCLYLALFLSIERTHTKHSLSSAGANCFVVATLPRIARISSSAFNRPLAMCLLCFCNSRGKYENNKTKTSSLVKQWGIQKRRIRKCLYILLCLYILALPRTYERDCGENTASTFSLTFSILHWRPRSHRLLFFFFHSFRVFFVLLLFCFLLPLFAALNWASGNVNRPIEWVRSSANRTSHPLIICSRCNECVCVCVLQSTWTERYCIFENVAATSLPHCNGPKQKGNIL